MRGHAELLDLSRAGRRSNGKPDPRSETNEDLFRVHVPSSRRPTHSRGDRPRSAPRDGRHSASRLPDQPRASRARLQGARDSAGRRIQPQQASRHLYGNTLSRDARICRTWCVATVGPHRTTYWSPAVSGYGTSRLPRECGVPPDNCRAGTPEHVLCPGLSASGQTAARSRPTVPHRRPRCRVDASRAWSSSRSSAWRLASPCVPGGRPGEHCEAQATWTEIPPSGPPDGRQAL